MKWDLKQIMAYAVLVALPILESFIFGTYFLCGLSVLMVTSASVLLSLCIAYKVLENHDAVDIKKKWNSKRKTYGRHLLDLCCFYLPLVFTLGVVWPLLLSLFNIIVVLPYLFKKLEENYGDL